MIREFRGQYYFLSNFFNAPVTYQGVSYKNNEAAFQSVKLENIKDREAFSNLDPSSAKHLGRKVNLRADWENIKLNVMYDIVKAKFSQNEKLKQLHLATGDKELIEGNTWHDNTYGNCFCPKCQNKKGINHLGKILMQVRSELKQQ